MKPEIVVYTALVGDYDNPRTDGIICFNDFSKFKKDVYNAKIYKVLSHQFIDADISMWVDGNIYLNVPPQDIVVEMLGDADIGVFKHPHRKCVYSEKAVCIHRDSSIKEEIVNQIKTYKDKDYPINNGLYECGVIIRRHNDKTEMFNNYWWSEICRHSNRDQLSFPYVLSKFPDLKIKITNGNVRENSNFRYVHHNTNKVI